MSRPMNRPPHVPSHSMHRRLLGAALLLALGIAHADDPGAAVEAAQQLQREVAEQARASAREALERERLQAQIERERAQFDRLSDEERRRAREQAREELRATQEELAQMAAKVAELSVRLRGEELEQALAATRVGRPVIGVVLGEDDERGVRLAAVSPGGPAAEAGLRAGDRILAINGTPVTGPDQRKRLEAARELIGAPREGEAVSLEIDSEGNTRTLTLEARSMGFPLGRGFDLEHLPGALQGMVSPRWNYEIARIEPMLCTEDPEHCADLMQRMRGWRGLRLTEVDAELGRYFGSERGVLVLRNEDKVGGLRGGDLILEVDGQRVDDPAELMGELRGGDDAEQRRLLVLRERKRIRLDVEVPRLGMLPFLFPLTPPPTPPAPPAPPAAPGAPAPVLAPSPPAAPAPRLHGSSHPSAAPTPASPARPAKPAAAPPPPPPPPGVLARVLQ